MSYRVGFVCNFSTLQDVTQAFRRLARKRHPDKGGSKEDFQRLRAVPCLVLFFFAIRLKIDWLFIILHDSWIFFLYLSLFILVYIYIYILMKLMNYIVFYCVFPMRHFCRDLSQLAIWCCPNHRSKAYELLTTAGIPEVDAPVPWARKKKVNTQLSWVVNQFGGMDGCMICPDTNSDATKMMPRTFAKQKSKRDP